MAGDGGAEAITEIFHARRNMWGHYGEGRGARARASPGVVKRTALQWAPR